MLQQNVGRCKQIRRISFLLVTRILQCILLVSRLKRFQPNDTLLLGYCVAPHEFVEAVIQR